MWGRTMWCTCIIITTIFIIPSFIIDTTYDPEFGKTFAQACPRLEHLGGLASWGRVEKEELEMMQQEVKARNLNLTLQ